MPIASGLSHVDEFLGLLRGVEENGDRKWKAYCPVHEADGASHDPSLNVAIGSDDEVLLHCFVCGEDRKVEIVHAAGSTMAKLWPKKEPKGKSKQGQKKAGGRKTAEYEYRDADGCLSYMVERYEYPDGSKNFYQCRRNAEGRRIYSLKGVARVLYRLPELIAATEGSTVFVVEGEKKVESLREWGLVATCNVGGAGKWNKEYSKYLKGHNVVILPDNDPVNPETGKSTGYDHACDIIDSTREVAKSIRILELPDLPPKGDIIDWRASGGTLSQLMQLLEQPAGELPSIRVATKKVDIADLDPLDLRVQDSRTDVGNARRLIKDHGQDLKFCHPWGKWLHWDGRRWKTDDTGEVYRRMIKVSDGLWSEWRQVQNDISDDMSKLIQGFVKSSSTEYSITKAIKCAGTLEGCQVLPKQLDSDPWILNCANGTVDLRTGELREHSRTDLLTKISSTEFNPDAECPSWEKFLKDVFQKEPLISYIQRLSGYWATGIVREQMLPVLWGSGSNGKTTFLNAITRAIGSDFCMKAPADFLMAKHQDTHPTDRADLFGKRLVVCAETDDGKRLAESMVKELTGDEAIRARRMREDFWEFDPTHKILLVTNHKPIIRGTDHGIWRRIRLIPFLTQFWNPHKGEMGPEEFRQDETLKDRLESEMSGILTWIVKGCIEWNRDGELTPEMVDIETKQYRSSQDVMGQFLEERCEVGSSYATQASELYAAYRKWAKDNGEYEASQRKFGLWMTERGFERHRNNGKWYQGIQLVQQNEF